MAFKTIIKYTEVDSLQRTGVRRPFNDIYGNHFFYALSEPVELKNVMKVSIYYDDKVFIPFYTENVSFECFVNPEYLDNYWRRVFGEYRYRFYAEAKHLVFEGIVSPEQIKVSEELETKVIENTNILKRLLGVK